MKPSKPTSRLRLSVTPPFPTLGTRIFAAFLDVLVIILLCQITNQGYFGKFLSELSSIYTALLVGFIYQMSGYLLLSSTYMKVILGMRIASETGHKMSVRQSFTRAFVMIVGILPVFLGYFYALTNVKRQSFHDKVARTLVVFDES